jgi:MATE family multidrug resistance protein
LAVAASTLVGRAIGAGDVRVARRFAALTAAVGAALSIGLGLVLGLARSPIAALFTTDAAVNALTAALLPLLGAILLVDGSTNALGGACSGLGLQRASAAGQLLGYWVIGMPAGVAVAFGAMRGARDGVFALWGGVGLSMLTASVVQLAVLLRLDWRKAAGEAEVRLRRGAADLDRALLAGEPTVNAVGVVPV